MKLVRGLKITGNLPLLGQVEVRRGHSDEVLQERAGGNRLGVEGNGQNLVEGSAGSGTIVEDEHGDGGGSIDTNEGHNDLGAGVGVLGGEVLNSDESSGDLSGVVVDQTTPDLANGVSGHGEFGHNAL